MLFIRLGACLPAFVRHALEVVESELAGKDAHTAAKAVPARLLPLSDVAHRVPVETTQ